jgi:hypothetical protein
VPQAPECLEEGVSSSVSRDLWAASVTAFYALAGQLPFPGRTLMQIARLEARQRDARW